MTSPIPEIIYLQWHGDQDPECLTKQELERKPSLDEVSWCWEQIFEYDIKYIRKDKFDAVEQQRDELLPYADKLRHQYIIGNDGSPDGFCRVKSSDLLALIHAIAKAQGAKK